MAFLVYIGKLARIPDIHFPMNVLFSLFVRLNYVAEGITVITHIHTTSILFVYYVRYIWYLDKFIWLGIPILYGLSYTSRYLYAKSDGTSKSSLFIV